MRETGALMGHRAESVAQEDGSQNGKTWWFCQVLDRETAWTRSQRLP